MPYNDWRTNAILGAYNEEVRDFVDKYKAGRPTVVLLPGGMGSRLVRSSNAYERGSVRPILDNTVWLDIGTLLGGEARALRIQRNNRDSQSHVIVPIGPLRFPVSAYDATETFFRHRNVNYNYVVFAYDWRRPLVECAEFLNRFLTLIKRRVFEKHNEDPSHNLTLLAHSQGGLVATLFLHLTPSPREIMRRLITVATPFYGNWSQHRRYFVGESALSLFYSRTEMAEIISTLHAPYNLLFPPRSIFDECEGLGLDRYPLRDARDEAAPDPFDMSSSDRYPEWVNRNNLQQARDAYKFIGGPLPAKIVNDVYNIRSVADAKTPVELVWNPLPLKFDPEGETSPILPAKRGLGDGTVPWWSAFHANVPAKNRRQFESAKEHTYIMEDQNILNLVQAVIDGKPIKIDPIPESGTIKRAAVERPGRAAALLTELAEDTATRNDERLARDKMWRGVYREVLR